MIKIKNRCAVIFISGTVFSAFIFFWRSFNEHLGCVTSFIIMLFFSCIIYFDEIKSELDIRRAWVGTWFKRESILFKLLKGGVFVKTKNFIWTMMLSTSLMLFVLKSNNYEILILITSIPAMDLAINKSIRHANSQTNPNIESAVVKRTSANISSAIVSVLLLIFLFFNYDSNEIYSSGRMAEIIVDHVNPGCNVIKYISRLALFLDENLIYALHNLDVIGLSGLVLSTFKVLIMFLIVVWMPVLAFIKGVFGTILLITDNPINLHSSDFNG